jgi:hypothetical protein
MRRVRETEKLNWPEGLPSGALVLKPTKRRREGILYSSIKIGESILVTLHPKTTSFWVFHPF